MRASKPEQADECLTENPYEFRIDDPDPPWFTIFSFLAVPVLALGSLLLLRDAPLPSELQDESLPNPVQDHGLLNFGILLAVAGLASLLGLILAHVASKRGEPWKGLRVIAWITNGVVAASFFYWVAQVALFALVHIVGRA